MITKIERATQMLVQGVDPQKREESYSINLRLPGDVAERVFAIYDMSVGEARQAGTSMSRNRMIVALIEAGIEAVRNNTEGKE
jgi:hypothetical protein